MKRKYIYLHVIVLLFCLPACEPSEESKVRKAAVDFIQGRIALGEEDSSLLRSVSADTLYRMIMINHRYIKLVNGNAQPLAELFTMRPGRVEINGNDATCFVKALDRYDLHLRKYGDTWKVRGENDTYPSQEMIDRTQIKFDEQQRIREQKPLFDSISAVVNDFYMSTKYHFRTPKPELLAPSCSPEVISLVERVKELALAKAGKTALFAEMDKQDFTLGDIERVGETVEFSLYQTNTTLTLKRLNGKYQIIGINGSDKRTVSDAELKANLLMYLRAMKIIRSEQYRDKELNNKLG